MADFCIRITSRPPGGAPEDIRDQWVGVVMPARETDSLLRDVMTGRLETDRFGGYAVLWEDAMNALGRQSPEARRWWEELRGRNYSELIFSPECCEVIPD